MRSLISGKVAENARVIGRVKTERMFFFTFLIFFCIKFLRNFFFLRKSSTRLTFDLWEAAARVPPSAINIE